MHSTWGTFEEFVGLMSAADIAIGGVESPYIKGIYKPSKETQGGFPVYLKKESNDHKLIFDPSSSKWKVKEKRVGDRWVTIAKVVCRPSGSPETINKDQAWEIRSENSRGFRYIPTSGVKVVARQN